MTRPEAIEAAARARFANEKLAERVKGIEPEFPTWESLDPGRQMDYEAEVEDEVCAAAPHIESALLDRIEERVWGLRMQAEYQSTSSVRSEAQLATLNAVSAILTEIRQGLDPAQSPEAGK